jgi:streptomycin 6-kinase
MSLFVPDRLQETAREFGEEGASWLAALPGRVAELERAWGFTAGRAFDLDGCVSWVAPVGLADGSQAVLKIGIPHDEARHEAAALQAWDGQGAARLMRVSEDGYTLLLERCVPGTNIWSLSVEEGNAVGAAVLRRLWRDPGRPTPFQSLADLAAEWRETLPETAPAAGYDADLIERAVALAGELAASQTRSVLLHGDYHPGNVLAAEREPWLAIDPKPLLGDPAYDLAQWLANRCEAVRATPDPVAAIRDQMDQMSALLDLDPARVAGWAFVKSLGWDWGPAAARLLLAALEA